MFALEVATVFANDLFDYESDRNNAATGPFNGGSRVLVEGKLDFRYLRAGIAVALVATLVCAGYVIRLAPRPGATIVLLAVAFVLTLGYTVPPFKLCWRGLGEVDVALSHSFMVLLFGFMLQGGRWFAPLPWLLAAPLCVAIVPAIVLSGLPDRSADADAGKGTLPVRLGARAATWLAVALTVAAVVLVLIIARLAPVHGAYDAIIWGLLPYAGLLVLVLLRLLHQHPDVADRRIDGAMLVALG